MNWEFILGFFIGILFFYTTDFLWTEFKSWLDEVKEKKKQIKNLQKEIAELKDTISTLLESAK